MNATQQLTQNIHKGIENKDLETLISCYMDNAEIRVIDQAHPPSAPRRVKGKQAIRDYYKDILSRDLTHHIDAEAVSEKYLAFTDECEYGDGTHVVANEMCEIRNGKIVKQTTVQAWDEA